jgi:hypothetical protein
MDKVEKQAIIEEFVEWMMEDKNSYIITTRRTRNDWLDIKLKEYKDKVIFKDLNLNQ